MPEAKYSDLFRWSRSNFILRENLLLSLSPDEYLRAHLRFRLYCHVSPHTNQPKR